MNLKTRSMRRTNVYVPVSRGFTVSLLAWVCVAGLARGLDFPGSAPGEAKAEMKESAVSLGNRVIGLMWRFAGEQLTPLSLEDKLAGVTLALKGTECFTVVLDDSPSPCPNTLKASDLRLVGKPAVKIDGFGTGTSLHELYIEPRLMTPETWDALAEAARWARANRDVLVDTHWIGGDAIKAEVYGFASWTPRKAILTLRNPDDRPASFALDVSKAFELPEGAPQTYALKSPWKGDSGQAAVSVRAGQAHRLDLKPFEVLVFDATPIRGTPQ